MNSRVNKIWIMTVLFFILVQSVAFAAPVVVLQSSEIEKTNYLYKKRLEEVEYGTVVVYESIFGKKSFRVGNLLGGGNTTLIYELLDHPDKVIRISKYHSSDDNNKSFFPVPRILRNSWINGTIKGYKSIENNGLPIVKLHDYRYDQYAIVDRVHFEFTMLDFLYNHARFNLSASEEKKIEKELIKFVEKLAVFDSIEDFGPHQVVYDKKKGWILIDWSGPGILHKSGYESPLEMFFERHLLPIDEPATLQEKRITEITGKLYFALSAKRDPRYIKSCASLFLD